MRNALSRLALGLPMLATTLMLGLAPAPAGAVVRVEAPATGSVLAAEEVRYRGRGGYGYRGGYVVRPYGFRGGYAPRYGYRPYVAPRVYVPRYGYRPYGYGVPYAYGYGYGAPGRYYGY